MTSIANKVAVVTGAAAGLGQGIALQLAEHGAAHVVAVDIDNAGLQQTAKMLEQRGTAVSTHVVDIASKEAVFALAEEVNEKFGGADILINNAGVQLLCPTAEAELNDIEWVININYWGVVYCSKAFFPQMQAKGSGHIANVSSVMGVFTTSMSSAYSSSKFAVRGFTESLRQELRSSGIHVSCVHPGGVKTNVMINTRFGGDTSDEQKQKAADMFDKVPCLTADEAAKRLVRGIEKNKKRIMIGADARLIDIVTRLLPSHYDTLLGSYADKQMREMRGG